MYTGSHFAASLGEALHSSWKDFLYDPQVSSNLLSAESQALSGNFTPDPGRVLRFMTLPLGEMKVIVLGQDPYPTKGVATGRAFEVGGLKLWSQPFRNVSLKNILRGVYSSYKGFVTSYSGVINDPSFPVPPPGTLFDMWERQGVMLLNTSFTCEIGRPGAHAGAWKNFTALLLRYIAGENPGLVWLLWGNHARRATAGITIKNRLESMHPMMCYPGPGRETDFLFGNLNHFHETRRLINWAGL